MAYRSSVHHLGLLDASSGETDVLFCVSLFPQNQQADKRTATLCYHEYGTSYH